MEIKTKKIKIPVPNKIRDSVYLLNEMLFFARRHVDQSGSSGAIICWSSPPSKTPECSRVRSLVSSIRLSFGPEPSTC